MRCTMILRLTVLAEVILKDDNKDGYNGRCDGGEDNIPLTYFFNGESPDISAKVE